MLYYESSGTGETIVLLHGALVSSRMWDSQVLFLKDKYRVLTIDLPEHGQSKDAVLAEYSIEMISTAVMELLQTLEIGSFYLCGHSLGGMVAQEIAIRHPECVRGLILAETSYGTTTTLLERIGTLAAKGMFALLSQKQLIEMSKSTYGMLHPSVRDFLQEEMALYSIGQSKRVMAAVFNYTSKDKLERLRMRTLILVAAENRQTYAQGKTLHEKILNSKLVRVSDAHHLLNMDNPHFFNSVLLQFLQNNDAGI